MGKCTEGMNWEMRFVAGASQCLGRGKTCSSLGFPACADQEWVPGQSSLQLFLLLGQLCLQFSNLCLELCNLLMQIVYLPFQLPLNFVQFLSALLFLLQPHWKRNFGHQTVVVPGVLNLISNLSKKKWFWPPMWPCIQLFQCLISSHPKE